MSEPDDAEDSESIFKLDPSGTTERFLPTPLARGPWHEGTQHGGPMLALLARAVERHPAERPVQVTRLTADLMRAAPMRAIETRVRTIRAGKSVEVVEASLLSEGEEYARATAMRFRLTELEVEPDLAAGDLLSPPDESEPKEWGTPGRVAFHHAVDMRPVRGLEMPALWMRLRVPLVEGETTSPLERLAAAADSVYSVPFISNILSNPGLLRDRKVISINPDTTINLHRQPRGEWICLQAGSHSDPSGAGTAFARLSDAEGAVGIATQSILLRGPQSRPESWKEFDKLIDAVKGDGAG